MTAVVPAKPVIPTPAWVVAGVVFAVGFFFLSLVMIRENNAPPPIRVLLPVLLPGLVAGYALLVGYVYGDARRRGMRHVLWTWLAILIPNGIGIILYFILRESMPSYCTTCGGGTQRGYAYCPRCGAGVAPACPQCRRVLQPGWTHCAYCGGKL